VQHMIVRMPQIRSPAFRFFDSLMIHHGSPQILTVNVSDT